MKNHLQISAAKPGARLEGVEAFLRVAKHRSFSAAARELGVSPSAISQTIRALENRIGVALLTRSTRSVGLTQAGELFLASAEPAFHGILAAYEAASSLGERPVGRLRINLMRAAVQPLFEPILAGFCDAYPEIELEIFADDMLTDLVAGGFDAGIRLGEALQADVVAMRLREPFRFLVAGTPAYFERFGRPHTPEDLRHHRCVRLRFGNGSHFPWSLMDDGKPVEIPVTGPVIVNDYAAHRLAVETGVALGLFAEPTIAQAVRDGKLEAVLTDHATTTEGLFLYYPERRQVMPKLRAFIDYLKANMPKSDSL